MSPTRRRHSSGQTLPMFAIMVPAILALMALGLDSAQIFLERRDAQSAADLAALAGVRSLPDGPISAASDAIAVGVAHGYQQAEVVPVTPYLSDPAQIEVTVNSSVDTFFMGIFGQSKVDVSARAVAKSDWTEGVSGSTGYAVFAMETGCSEEKSVDMSGSDDFFIGRVHSNSDVYVSGSNNDFDGSTTYVCGITNGGGGNTFDPAPAPGYEEPDPVELDWDHFCPVDEDEGLRFDGPSDWDLSVDGEWWDDSDTLLPGTYCSSGTIKLSGSDIDIAEVGGETGITFAADKVEISGSNFTLTPYQGNILFAAYANADDAMKISGSGGDWIGLIYAPNGVAELSGQSNGNDDFDLGGGVIGKRVKLNGSDAHIDGTIGETPAVDPEQVISLVE